MLGKRDIENELGKGINIYPFHEKNLKENSINFTVGQNAWTLGKGSVKKKSKGTYCLVTASEKNNKNTISFQKGKSAIVQEGNEKYMILLPHSTTIVETSEVLSVSNYIGGTFHSKVGIVNLGIGDIGTMLGPCFSGHLMFALHNITDEVRTLKVGDTFVSLVFYYLKTANDNMKNTNISGHVDKLSELNIYIDSTTREYLTEEWKQDIKQVSKKMKESEEYKRYLTNRREYEMDEYKRYLTPKNFGIGFALAICILLLGIAAYYADVKCNTTVWEDRFWTIIITSIIVPLVMSLKKIFKKRDN